MAARTYYAVSKLDLVLLQGGTFAFPTSLYAALIQATAGYWTASTAYTVGQTIVPTSPNGRLYQCTTAGTSAATQPTWPTTDGGTVTDGTAVWTEMTPTFEAGTITEVSATSTGYARVAVASNTTNWPNPVNGVIYNGTAITFPTATASWGLVFGVALFDAVTAGNLWLFGPLTAPQSVASGITVQYDTGNLSLTG